MVMSQVIFSLSSIPAQQPLSAVQQGIVQAGDDESSGATLAPRMNAMINRDVVRFSMVFVFNTKPKSMFHNHKDFHSGVLEATGKNQ